MDGGRLGYSPYIVWILACLLLGLGDATARAFLCGAAILWALRGPVHSLQALSIGWLLGNLNPGLTGDVSTFETLLRWLVILSAAGRGLLWYGLGRGGLPDAIVRLGVFAVVVAGASLLVAFAPDLALLKLAGFTFGAFAVLAACDQGRSEWERIDQWFVALAVVLCLASLVLYPLPVGFHRNGTGFQGVLNHPQAFGVTMAPIVAWFLFRPWGDGSRWWLSLAAFAIGLVLTMASLARTAMMAFLAAAAIAAVSELVRRRVRQEGAPRVIALVGVAAITAMMVPRLVTYAEGFVLKGARAGTLEQIYEKSRGMVVRRSLQGFYEHPLLGIGFGLPSNPWMLRASRDATTGITVGAPVEKGVTFAALLEETGVVGAGLFLWFFAAVADGVWRQGSAAAVALAAAAVLVNFGEAILLSFGGIGLFNWLMLGWATVMRR